MGILQQTSVPRRLQSNVLASSSPWFTWAPAFRQYIKSLKAKSLLKRRVRLLEVAECRPYGATYATHLGRLSYDEHEILMNAAEVFCSIRARNSVLFFRDMLEPTLSSAELRAFLSMLREAIVRRDGQQASALYSPVTPEKRDPGFNLHADLFLTPTLLLLFDDVPADGTGSSLLLPRSKLVKIMKSCPALPDHVRSETVNLLDRPLRKDSFDKLYGLLHSEAHPWRDDLNMRMKAAVLSVEMHRGDGYLLDDRRWLHGRTAVSCSVSKWRFHRLTFGPMKTRHSVDVSHQ